MSDSPPYSVGVAVFVFDDLFKANGTYPAGVVLSARGELYDIKLDGGGYIIRHESKIKLRAGRM